jgi:hypothetical protein
MTASAAKHLSKAIGQSPEALTLEERLALAGKMIALEIYSAATTPLRRIEAIGDSAAECIAQLHSRGLDPANFEFSRLQRPY